MGCVHLELGNLNVVTTLAVLTMGRLGDNQSGRELGNHNSSPGLTSIGLFSLRLRPFGVCPS